MNYKLLAGVAAGAGLLYLFSTPKGRDILKATACKLGIAEDKYEELLGKGADKLKNLTHKVADTSQIPA